jgi:hypothetical protein
MSAPDLPGKRFERETPRQFKDSCNALGIAGNINFIQYYI